MNGWQASSYLNGVAFAIAEDGLIGSSSRRTIHTHDNGSVWWHESDCKNEWNEKKPMFWLDRCSRQRRPVDAKAQVTHRRMEFVHRCAARARRPRSNFTARPVQPNSRQASHGARRFAGRRPSPGRSVQAIGRRRPLGESNIQLQSFKRIHTLAKRSKGKLLQVWIVFSLYRKKNHEITWPDMNEFLIFSRLMVNLQTLYKQKWSKWSKTIHLI